VNNVVKELEMKLHVLSADSYLQAVSYLTL